MLFSEVFSDWLAGLGTIDVRIGDEKVVKATLRRGADSSGLHFDIHTPMVNPAVPRFSDQIEDILTDPNGEGRGFPINFKLPRGEWCWSAVCQSAYLLLFDYFGYDFARDDTYEPLRQQVLVPDRRVWDGNIWVLSEATAAALLQGEQAAVVFTRNPFRAVLAVMLFLSPRGQSRMLAVVLPGPGEPPVEEAEQRTFEPAVVPYEPEFAGTMPGFFGWRWNRYVTCGE